MKDGRHVVLCIDDEKDVTESLSIILEANDYHVVTAESAKEGLELFKKDFAGKLGKRLRVEIGDIRVKLDFVYKQYESVGEAVEVAEEFTHDDNIAAVIGFPTSAKATQVGKITGRMLGKKVEILGGFILIAIGVRILVTHLT